MARVGEAGDDAICREKLKDETEREKRNRGLEKRGKGETFELLNGE